MDVRVGTRVRILLIFLKRLVPALPRRFFFCLPKFRSAFCRVLSGLRNFCKDSFFFESCMPYARA